MNDFTKEELQEIYTSISQHALEGWANLSVELIQKIQSMIDSYCEHEFLLSTDSEHLVILCNKCTKIYGNLE